MPAVAHRRVLPMDECDFREARSPNAWFSHERVHDFRSWLDEGAEDDLSVPRVHREPGKFTLKELAALLRSLPDVDEDFVCDIEEIRGSQPRIPDLGWEP
jgi:hypothetical protein